MKAKLIAISLASLFLLGCSGGASKFAGKWVSASQTIQLLKDGTAIISMGGMANVAGTWKSDDANGIIIQFSALGTNLAVPAHLSDDRLLVTQNGKTDIMIPVDPADTVQTYSIVPAIPGDFVSFKVDVADIEHSTNKKLYILGGTLRVDPRQLLKTFSKITFAPCYHDTSGWKYPGAGHVQTVPFQLSATPNTDAPVTWNDPISIIVPSGYKSQSMRVCAWFITPEGAQEYSHEGIPNRM